MGKKEKRVKQPGTKKRGGARPGAGRPASLKTYSERIKASVMEALEIKEKESGLTFGQVIVNEIYRVDSQGNLRGICMKLVADMLSIRETKQIVEKIEKPQIYLPQVAERPKEFESAEESFH